MYIYPIDMHICTIYVYLVVIYVKRPLPMVRHRQGPTTSTDLGIDIMADQTVTTPSRRATLLGAVAIASSAVAVSGSAKASQISPAMQKAFDEWQALVAIDTKEQEAQAQAELRLSDLLPVCPDDILRKNTHHGLTRAYYVGDFAYVPGIGEPFEQYATSEGFQRIVADYSRMESDGCLTNAQAERKAEAERLLIKAENYEADIAAANEMSGIEAAEVTARVAFLAAHDGFVRFTRIRPKTMAEIQFQAVHVAEWCEGGEALDEFILDWMKLLAQFVS